MTAIGRCAPLVALVLAMAMGAAGQELKPSVVAAENFYGDIARQIGGDRVDVASILSNPDQDPHLFETTPTIVRQIAAARIVILNGADYDAWMDKLLKAAPRVGRTVLAVAELVNKKAGDNPHLWYDPATMPTVARALAAAFSKADPAHAADYAARLATLLASLERIGGKVAEIRAKHAGVAITATEPVFGYMASALGLKVRNERLQMAVMNDTEPSARDIAAFEQDLKEHRVRVLLYNKQTGTKLTQRMLEIARRAKIPVVGVTETQPMGVTYQDWMLMQLAELQNALAQPST
ncbi:MAG TPA: zinc ABC transporter substrate-binding protein [Xanthobacteraceae bacterium]|nr:zinc ABC transporter substrate-binding protein [Xanthobacteraceae bacterium]